MLPDRLSRGNIHNRARLLADRSSQEALGVAVGNKANVVAVRLTCCPQTPGLCLSSHLGLDAVAQGEQAVLQKVAFDDREDVGLILVRIHCAMELRSR